MVEPVLKWAGGKRQILDSIRECLPPAEDCEAYHEPFFGGGALYFKTPELHGEGTINDINERLMDFYRIVRDRPSELVEVLESFDGPEQPPDDSREFCRENRKRKEIDQYYYQQRELFNRRPNDEEYDEVEEAALLAYLNRTCYNGLYRENQSGEFNVPIGSYSNANWVHKARILAASEALQDIEIKSGDFDYVREVVGEDDLVYCDPPYRPVSTTSSFVEYSSESFGPDQQKRLCNVVEDLYKKNKAHVVVSNSPPISELYDGIKGLTVHMVGAKRFINSKGDDRGEVGEIIITSADERRAKMTSLDEFGQA